MKYITQSHYVYVFLKVFRKKKLKFKNSEKKIVTKFFLEKKVLKKVFLEKSFSNKFLKKKINFVKKFLKNKNYKMFLTKQKCFVLKCFV